MNPNQPLQAKDDPLPLLVHSLLADYKVSFISSFYKKKKNKTTRFIKSADSSDQPSGICDFFIEIYLAKIWSRISFLLFPT